MSVVAAEQRAARVLSTEDYRKYLPIVRRAAMRLARKVPAGISVADLTSCAWTGLVDAFARASDDADEAAFEAYATYKMRGAMLDFLRGLDAHAREARAASRKLARAIGELSKRFGRAPDEEEIASELGLPLAEYHATLSSLDRAGMNRLEVIDLDVDPDGVELGDDPARREEMASAVARAIQALPDKLQALLALYYTEECTPRETATILDVSETRVAQLHTEAVHRLRAAIGKE
ncbi:MAG: sigma-70 family RNA polymerase sigma factor [Labilithrix sp.]|nr:sigma-70 family RNA polymerase sigma factor [Labilithrix sp.]